MKPAHHRGAYATNRNRVVAAANANPRAVCWRDGLTLAQHPATTKTGRPNTWTGGHTRDGDPHAQPWLNVEHVPPPGSWLAPEAMTCNASNGAHRTNRHRANPRSRTWL